ncbi:glycoside hydrolase family 79 protein [Laetiporus sulphureus 93-53]|uniref:Glycoside hydrolase family 79 protein n=1 Tax=Laetiporus sulphureus 93-53 TaxID=1314785 RepID=A0A165IMQ1_9APHY|nr:glycoside hydrolase family 79 protein [Laetiporus sulphureus 93-53]KZT13293.1 glycoside hydrolase family 79 protein [Laetiporus sulphureus 93-53]
MFPNARIAVSLAVLLGLASAANVTTVNVTVTVVAPSKSQPLSSTLLSFSIEQDNWPDWSGIDSRNEFTYNAMMNYANLTGQPPKFRVGADSEDHTVWSPTVTINKDEFPPSNSITPYPEATMITVGSEYYTLSRWLPAGTRMIWGVNLGFNNITNARNMAKAIVAAFSSPSVIESGVILERIEVGNEADLYGSNGLRPSGYWTVQDYVFDWESVALPVIQAAGISTRFGPVTLQGAAFSGQGFTPREIFSLGILESTPGETISTISQHQYSAAFCDGGNEGLTSFMNKTSIRGNLTIFDADIAATYAKGLNYILGETNSVACHGAPGVSNTAGAALWMIDHTLFSSTFGISELYFHEGIGYKYNFLQPITLNYSTIDGSILDPPEPPHIQPPYYGGLVVDTLVGNSGAASIVELDVPENDTTGYAVYESGTLARAVFVNLNAWTTNSTGTRPVVHIDLDFAFGVVSSASARRLVINYADDTSNLTWAGQSYEESSDISPTGQLVLEDINVEEGLDLRATEAILLTF